MVGETPARAATSPSLGFDTGKSPLQYTYAILTVKVIVHLILQENTGCSAYSAPIKAQCAAAEKKGM